LVAEFEADAEIAMGFGLGKVEILDSHVVARAQAGDRECAELGGCS